MLDELTLPQLREWKAFSELEPFGTTASWAQHGALMAIIANIVRDPKKTSPYSVTDFIPND